jgi:hypothetical protein
MFSFCFLVVLRVAVLRVLAIGMFSLQDIDGGLTFGNNTNLSDNPDTNSDRVIMLAEGDNVYVTIWETVKGKQQVMRVSNENGTTFGLYSRYLLMNFWWWCIARKERMWSFPPPFVLSIEIDENPENAKTILNNWLNQY